MERLLSFVEEIAQHTPLELFAFVGAFIEEVLAPIPSPFVMTLAGSIAEAQARPFAYLLVIALIASLGKTLGAMLLYWLADKVEDVVMSRVGRFVGITHVEVEKFGNRLSNGTSRDFYSLLAIRATPIIPSAPISLLCGFVKIDFRRFVSATFLGTIVRDFVYLYFGYTSLGAADAIVNGIEDTQSIVTLLMALIGVAVVGWIVYQRKFKNRA